MGMITIEFSSFNYFYLHAVILLIFGLLGIIVNIKPRYGERILYASALLSISIFTALLLTKLGIIYSKYILNFMRILLTLFVASLACTISSQYSIEKEIEANFKGKQYFIGSVLKSYSVSLVLAWVLFKLSLFPPNWLPIYLPTIDSLLGYALLTYILGAAFESIEASSTLRVIGGFFHGLATSSIFALVISYVIQWLGLVREWQRYHEAIFNILIVSIIVSILMYVVMASGENFFYPYEIKKKKPKVRILYSDIDFYLHDKMKLTIKGESIFIPFRIEGYFGGYIQGNINYYIDAEIKKIRGKADEILILSKQKIPNELYDRSEEIEREDFIFRNINMNKLSERISSLISEFRRDKKPLNVIRLPFIKIIEGEEFNYVKVGPITIYDINEGGSYIKIGPIKIIDGDINNILSTTYLIIQDINRGTAKIVANRNKLTINISGEKIKLSKEYEEYSTKGKRITISDKGMTISIDNTKIILEGDERAIIKKPDKKIIADRVTGTLIIITKKLGKKIIRDRDQVLKTIKRAKESANRILAETLKEPEIKEVKDLIKYLDELLKR